MLKKTALNHIHRQEGAKMVSFAGFEMPLQYPNGIIHEHKCVRNSVGLFDVSHMGEIRISGKDAEPYLNRITVNNVTTLVAGQAHYTVMCYNDGGIVDDLLIYKFPNDYLCIINASNIEKDVQWMNQNKNHDDVTIDNVSDSYTQLSIQGRNAENTLQKLTKTPLSDIKYYHFVEDTLADIPMIISRTGYTGESGFELYFAPQKSEHVWFQILKAGKEFDIEPIGLGARDSLRLEKKMALYGNDIDETTNPIEAGLGWITKLEKKNFIGKKEIQKIKKRKPKRRLVPLLFKDKKAFPRKGYPIVDAQDNEIGIITSGTISPILNQGIAMAYVPLELAKEGTKHFIKIRKNIFSAHVIKGTFV